MRRYVVVFLLVGLMASVASATVDWTGATSSDWAVSANWSAAPTTTERRDIAVGSASTPPVYDPVVSADSTAGVVMMGRTNTSQTIVNTSLTISSGTLTVTSAGGELFSVAYSDNLNDNLTVNGGGLTVYRGDGTGEIRLNHVYSATCKGNVTLKGGTIDVEYLNKGDKAGGGNFTGQGGTLLVRNQINKFGQKSENSGYGFYLGGATLEMASFSTRSNVIGKVLLGSGQNMDFYMDSTSKVKFDLGLSQNKGGVAGTNWDQLQERGLYTIAGTLLVNFLVAPDAGDYWDVWVPQSGQEGATVGSGSFASVPSSISVSWVGDDVVRLTYIPEPATVALLGLGLLALRRNKK